MPFLRAITCWLLLRETVHRPSWHRVAPIGVALSLLVGHAACSGGPARPERGETNVLLITIDTLRADRLGCYGYGLPTSPHIDRLAERGVRFADCTVQWPKTWPSMASLMTGSYPKTTGMTIARRRLSPSLLMMSEVFRKAGYATGAVVATEPVVTTS